MQKDFDVNPAYEAWKLSAGQEKEQRLGVLVKRLERFATAICWQRLPDHKDNFGPLINGIIWKAIRHADQFNAASKFSTWFYRIVINDCNRFLRNHKRRNEASLEEEMPADPQEMDARLDLIAILNGLEGQDHVLFRLVAEGLDFRTIAETLGITRNAAMVRWTRLKEKIRNARAE